MKVILLHNVPKIGRKLDVKEVSSGYAANFLFPRGLAERATPAKINALEEKKKAQEKDKEMQDELLQKDLEKLSGLTVEISAPANEQGHLFGGVHTEEITAALADQHRIHLSPEIIKLEHPIKEAGEHTISCEGAGGGCLFKLSVTAGGKRAERSLPY